jgi:Carboxypeptidase regulatory-like domain/Putative zinc-finger
MENVPKIVRERLRVATPAVNHPDADALTAFAERSLPELERDVVLEHLARCGDCRDIVALALPAMEPVESSMKPSPSGWLTWPALRWGFVAAGVVLIASLGILRYQARFQPGTMSASNNAPSPRLKATEAKDQPLAAPAPPPSAPAEKREKIEAPAAPAFADSLMMDNAPARDKKIASSVAPPSPVLAQQFHGSAYGSAIRRGVAGGNVGGPMVANQWQQNAGQNLAAAPVPSSVGGKQDAAGTLTAGGQAPAANQTVVNQPADASGADAFAMRAQNTNTTVLQYDAAATPVERAKPLPLPAPGQIGGYVVDPTGAGVSSARVTVIPSTMGGATTTITNSQGIWLVAGLPTGNYKVAAEAPGFTTTVKDLHYDANQPKMYSLSLSPGSVSETVEVSAEATQLQTESANVAGAMARGANTQIPLNGRNTMKIVTLAPGGLQTFWALNPAGGLERSFDQGKTWQTVDVNANPALYAASLAVTAEISKAKAKDSENARKIPPSPIFRALAVSGTDVWVGGRGGALYRSVDAGNLWTRIVPVASGKALTADVVSLEFADAQHGKLSTSTAEVWITADAGQTWQKQ